MKRIVVIIIFLCVLCVHAFGQEYDHEAKSDFVPLTMVFHNLGWNALHTITHNYGLNMIGAGLGTWAFIETGIDWKWSRLAYNNAWMQNIGSVFNLIGYVVPPLTPVALYLAGFAVKDEKLQITALALTQSLALTLLIQTPSKIITARTFPGIVDGWDSSVSKRSDRTDDYSGEFNWFNLEIVSGWPSGHAANAFAAAATIAQIYHDNLLLKIAVYTYASLLGLGMSVYDHWASDVAAGALIGLAVGTTVGRSYRSLTEGQENKVTPYITTDSIGVIIRM